MAVSTGDMELSITHPCPLLPNRVSKLVVEVRGSSGMVPLDGWLLRLNAPGVQIEQAEVPLTTGLIGRLQATMYLTPLAKGTIPDARLEVYHHGQLCRQIPLDLRVRSLMGVWVGLALLVIVPLLLFTTSLLTSLDANATQEQPFVVRWLRAPIPPMPAMDQETAVSIWNTLKRVATPANLAPIAFYTKAALLVFVVGSLLRNLSGSKRFTELLPFSQPASPAATPMPTTTTPTPLKPQELPAFLQRVTPEPGAVRRVRT
jgi:hypothetical protein